MPERYHKNDSLCVQCKIFIFFLNDFGFFLNFLDVILENIITINII
jgi:hypothetical protein